MRTYLNKHNSQSAFEDFFSTKEESDFPRVDYIEDTGEVIYNKTAPHNYSKDYLTFEALEDGTFTLTVPANVDSNYMTSVSYSTDNGETWTDTAIDNTKQTITTPTITSGSKVLWKGIGKQMAKSSSVYSQFSSIGNFNLSGNIMSLLYGDEFQDKTAFSSESEYNFTDLFSSVVKLVSVKNLVLPATILTNSCYFYIFLGCTSLTTAPELPATTLAVGCYASMFQNCSSLTTVPELLSTTLAQYCYYGMFSGCTSLTVAPELPATTLTNNCYAAMFGGCTSLTQAPELPATTLANSCYQQMFQGCTSLTTAPELPATTLAYGCYVSMFGGCTSLTTTHVLPATILAESCYSQMFYGCSSLTIAPELPATTLANGCYSNMFGYCTSLTTAPELPATTLANSCYNYMFYNCTNLNYIKALFTTTPSTSYTGSWVSSVASTGTFVKNSSATWDVTGPNGIPFYWTVETATE
jgi:hypothetical protein